MKTVKILAVLWIVVLSIALFSHPPFERRWKEYDQEKVSYYQAFLWTVSDPPKNAFVSYDRMVLLWLAWNIAPVILLCIPAKKKESP